MRQDLAMLGGACLLSIGLVEAADAQPYQGYQSTNGLVPSTVILCPGTGSNAGTCTFSGGGGGGTVTQGPQAATATGNSWFFQGDGTAGTPAGGVVTIQGVSGGTPQTVTGTGTAGTPSTAVMTIQGISGGTVIPVSGTVTAAQAATTPAAGTASAIVTGGTAVTLVTGPVNGCTITNPLSATDQNIATAEVAYINPVTTATANGRGTNNTLQPGQTWNCIPGQTTSVSIIAATTAHAFSVVKW